MNTGITIGGAMIAPDVAILIVVGFVAVAILAGIAYRTIRSRKAV